MLGKFSLAGPRPPHNIIHPYWWKDGYLRAPFAPRQRITMQSWIITIVTAVVGKFKPFFADRVEFLLFWQEYVLFWPQWDSEDEYQVSTARWFNFWSHVAIGVDLGTTFSVVGVSMNGKVHIIEDDAGHQIFPSIVSYFDNGGKHIASIASPHCA